MKTNGTTSTRQRILDAARNIIMDGDTNPSMSEIAVKARVSKSALYYFFKNKRDILIATMRSVFATYAEAVDDIAKQDIDAKEKLHEVMRYYSKSIKREDAVSQLLFRQIFSHDLEVLRNVISERKKIVAAFVRIIEEGTKTGVFRKSDSKQTAEIVVGFLDFLVIVFTLPCPKNDKECDFDPESLCDQLLELLYA